MTSSKQYGRDIPIVWKSDLTEAQRTELERRLNDYKKDPKAGSTWHEVKARILNRS
jgi:putative addiction module component (TIGR02574 family)